jgi:uncharacterized protein YndB with AHSA1/START domain
MQLRDDKLRDEKATWVERETVVEASPEEVWEALTDADRLEEWMAPEVELDPIEGGEVTVRDGDDERTGTVETVVEDERLAFTWSRPGQGESFVEFTIEAIPTGTRVRVVETPIGPTASFFGGWSSRLGLLRRSLRFAPVA